MNPEPEQAESKAEPKAPKRRTGVPVWRTGKPDAVLAAAVDVGPDRHRRHREGIRNRRHLAARTEGDRVVTHLFESRLPGYLGWQWYAVLTRNSRSKVITVNELGLLPSEDSILAPEWVPWAERVRPEDAQEMHRTTQEAPGGGRPTALKQSPTPKRSRTPRQPAAAEAESDGEAEPDAQATRLIAERLPAQG